MGGKERGKGGKRDGIERISGGRHRGGREASGWRVTVTKRGALLKEIFKTG